MSALNRFRVAIVHRSLVLVGSLMMVTTGMAEERAPMLPSAPETLTPDKAEKLAALYFKLGQTDECRTMVTALLRKAPNDLAGLLILARLEFRLGHYPEASKAASSALAVSADDVDATLLKASALSAMGKAAEAEKLFARVPAADRAKRIEDLALTLNGGAKPAAAITDETSSPTDGDQTDAALEEARKALAAKEHAKADLLTAAAMKRWPANHDAIALRADYLAEADRSAEALPLLEKLKAAHDPSTGPFREQIDLAFALQDLGKTKGAKAAFEAVLADKRSSDEDRASATKALDAQRQAVLLADGDKALDRGDKTEALRIDALVQKQDPADPDVQAFHANVLRATGHSEQAVEIFSALKTKAESGKRFDPQIDFAAALATSQRYEAAANAYNEVLASPGLYKDDERKDAADELQDLRDHNAPGIQAEFVAGHYDEGNLWRASNQFMTERFSQTRYLARFGWDSISLSDRQFPVGMNADRFAASVGIDHQFDSQWNGKFLVGGFDQGIMASGIAEYTTADSLTASMRLGYNDPSRDTLLLEAMDGRQHSISANFASPIGKYFAVDSMVIGRQIEVDGQNIGRSIGMEAQFRWHPLTVSEDYYFAYELELKHFSADEDAFDRQVRSFFGSSTAEMPGVYDAVPHRINRHALQAHAGVPLTSKVKAAATAEVAWRQEVQKTECAVTAEVLWKITDRTALNVRVEYYTGGAGPNTNGNVVLGTVGLKWTW